MQWTVKSVNMHRLNSFSGLLGSVHWGDSQTGKTGSRDQTQSANVLISTDEYTSAGSHPEPRGPMPIMDHWNASRPLVSLREIMEEEQALQNNLEKVTRTPTAPADSLDFI